MKNLSSSVVTSPEIKHVLQSRYMAMALTLQGMVVSEGVTLWSISWNRSSFFKNGTKITREDAGETYSQGNSFCLDKGLGRCTWIVSFGIILFTCASVYQLTECWIFISILFKKNCRASYTVIMLQWPKDITTVHWLTIYSTWHLTTPC